MMDAFCLVNLNARLYDPMLGRMTSEDPVVADPASAQSFDGYSYASNEPLAYADPTGEMACDDRRELDDICATDPEYDYETVVVTGQRDQSQSLPLFDDLRDMQQVGGLGGAGGGAHPAKPPDPNDKKAQCSRAANLASSVQKGGFATAAAGGATAAVGLIIAGLSALVGQPEGVAFGIAIAESGGTGLDVGAVTGLIGSIEKSYATGNSSAALSAGAGEATSQAVEAAAAAVNASSAGKLVGAVAGQQLENNLNSGNSASCGT